MKKNGADLVTFFSPGDQQQNRFASHSSDGNSISAYVNGAVSGGDIRGDIRRHGGLAVETDTARRRAQVMVSTSASYQPPDKLLKLSAGERPKWMETTAKIDLEPGDHLLVPVDQKSQAALVDLGRTLKFLPADYEELIMEVIRRPSLEWRIARLEQGAGSVRSSGQQPSADSWKSLLKHPRAKVALLWVIVPLLLILCLSIGLLGAAYYSLKAELEANEKRYEGKKSEVLKSAKQAQATAVEALETANAAKNTAHSLGRYSVERQAERAINLAHQAEVDTAAVIAAGNSASQDDVERIEQMAGNARKQAEAAKQAADQAKLQADAAQQAADNKKLLEANKKAAEDMANQALQTSKDAMNIAKAAKARAYKSRFKAAETQANEAMQAAKAAQKLAEEAVKAARNADEKDLVEVQKRALGAQKKANEAKRQADEIMAMVESGRKSADNSPTPTPTPSTDDRKTIALQTANEAQIIAKDAAQTADQAMAIAKHAQQAARDAREAAVSLKVAVSPEIVSRANKAMEGAIKARDLAEQSQRQAEVAKLAADLAHKTANEAADLSAAETAKKKAEEAKREATTARSYAEDALKMAKSTKDKADAARAAGSKPSN